MAAKIAQGNSKEIVALSIFEAVRLRSEIYIGQVKPYEDKLPIIREGKLKMFDKVWSPGFMHLIVEVLENALDEAKRCNGKMKNVSVSVNLDTNEVVIIDEGTGFYNAALKHPKTKKNVVRTALEELHAGSNFIDTSTNILGTHGVGSAVTNILSEKFEVTTVNKTHSVHYQWKDFKVVKEVIRKKEKEDKIGTSISFIPSPLIFPNFKWDKELISTYLSFKAFLIKSDPIIKDLNLKGIFIKDGKEEVIEIISDFIDGEFIKVESKLGSIYLWESYNDSGSLSFINGSQCIGIHQKIVNDWCNEYFKYNLSHHFFETLVSLNVPSYLMRFQDQNKTRYAISRSEIEEQLQTNFKTKLISHLKKSEISKNIEQNIEDRLKSENLAKIKKAKRQSKRKISEKYSPPSKRKGTIYITEGLCLEENTKIFIIRNNKILYLKLKDVKKKDLVISHKNKLQEINHINKSIKKGVKIQTSIGDMISSEKHKWFVYNKNEDKFYFEETKNLDKNKHQLVKNYLAFLESFDEITNINITSEKIIIINDKKEEWEISKNNKICIFDINKNQFIMKNSNDLKKGDILCKLFALSGT